MLKSIFDFVGGLVGGVFGILLMLVFSVGGLYWLWMAIQLESFFMFLVGVFPVFFIVTAPIGAWMMFFGPPDWILNVFG